MKQFSLILFICVSFSIRANDTLFTYFDSQWNEVPKEKAFYYRKMFKNEKKIWTVNDFFITGQIQMSGTYKSKKLKKKSGHFVYYFENGHKQSEGNYLNNHKDGEWNYWFETGEIKLKGNYYDEGKEIGYWKGWYKNGNCDFEGNYLNGEYNGEWKYYFENGQISSIEIYNLGELKDIKFWNEEGKQVEGNLKAESLPEFIGGQNALMEYLSNFIKYPESAVKSKITGKVIIRFVVAKDGKITNVEVFKSLNPLLDEEALKVIKNMPDWIPGHQHNRPVSVYYMLPINFKLR